jgi:hypothetical protein
MIKFIVTQETESREVIWGSPADFDAVFAEARRLMTAGATYVQIISNEVELICMHHNDFGGHRISGSPRPEPTSWSTTVWAKTKTCKNGVVIFSRWVVGLGFETYALWRERELQKTISQSLASAEANHSSLVSSWGRVSREELDILIEGAPRGPRGLG